MRARPTTHYLKHCPRGFTLIEMMIVIAIAAIIMIFAVPSFQDALDRHRLKSVAETMRSDLEVMKMESVKRSAVVSLSIRNDNATTADWCYGLSQSTSCNCKSTSCVLDGVSKVVSYDNYSGVRITAPATTSPTPFNITVEQIRGTITVPTGSTLPYRIRLTSARSKELDIEISALGRFIICSPSGSANVAGYPICT